VKFDNGSIDSRRQSEVVGINNEATHGDKLINSGS